MFETKKKLQEERDALIEEVEELKAKVESKDATVKFVQEIRAAEAHHLAEARIIIKAAKIALDASRPALGVVELLSAMEPTSMSASAIAPIVIAGHTAYEIAKDAAKESDAMLEALK